MWYAGSLAATCCAYCTCEACKTALNGIGRGSARIAYVVLFALSLVLAWLVRDYAEPFLHYVSWLDTLHVVPIPTAEWLKTQGVLRVTAGAFLFFSTFAALLANVEDESDYRDSWHHGGWMMKILMLLGFFVVAFLLPDGVITAYEDLAWVGAALFLFFQIVLLLDFVYAWNDAWASQDDDSWYMAMLVVSVFCYAMALVGLVLLSLWFSPGGHHCQFNSAVLFLTFLLILIFTLTSLHEQVNGSLLPSSIVAIYSVYLGWAVLSSEPTDYICNGMAAHRRAMSGGRLAMSVLLTLLSVAYSALRAGSSSMGSSNGHEEPLRALTGSNDDHEAGGDSSSRSGPVAYNYSFFHMVFALAAMYCGLLLTGWGSSEGAGDEKVIDVGWHSVYMKLAQQWATGLLYTWSLVAPLLIPDRDFS